MSAFARLWIRAPTWRGALLLGVALSGLAVLYPPPLRRPVPGARYVSTPLVPSPSPAAVPAATPALAPPARTADPNLPAFGAVVATTVRFAGTNVPLPRGEWRVVAAMGGRTPQGQVAASSVLAQVTNGALNAAVILFAVVPPSATRGGFSADPLCQSPHSLFSRVFSAVDHGPQACWTVEAIAAQDWDAADTPPFVRSGVAELKQQGTALPTVVLRAYFAHADADHLLTMQVIEAVPSPLQAPFGWQMEEVRRTPDKLARVVRLRDWAQRWNVLVRRSFEGQLNPMDVTPELDALPH